MPEEASSTIESKGKCPDCGTANPYTAISCSNCRQRLPWADTYAATSGEPCPKCGKFNCYLHETCDSCGTRLPWWDAFATRRHNSGEADREGISTSLMMVVFGALAFWGMIYIVMKR